MTGRITLKAVYFPIGQSGLDGVRECGWMLRMKTILWMAMAASLLLACGCVNTVNEGKTGGFPWVEDSVESRYPDRTPEEVLEASKAVISKMGVVRSDSNIYGQTNLVKGVEGRVNQRSVYVRIEALNPKLTSVVVQTRTSGGGSDMDLTHEIDKQIALKLVH
jgi:hypothetical protein